MRWADQGQRNDAQHCHVSECGLEGLAHSVHDRDCGICLLVFWGNPPLPRVHAYASFPHERRDARGVPRLLRYNDRWATQNPTIPARKSPWAPIGRRAMDEDSQNCPIWRLLRNLTGFRRPPSPLASAPSPPLPPRSGCNARSPRRRLYTSPNTSISAPICRHPPRQPRLTPSCCLAPRQSPPGGTMAPLPKCWLQLMPLSGSAWLSGAISSQRCRVTAPPHPFCCYRGINQPCAPARLTAP